MKRALFLALILLVIAVGAREMAGQSSTPPPEEINPTGNAGALKPQIQTGGSYDAHSGNATRIVNDLSVPGALGMYGLDFTRYWNSTHNDYQDSAMEWPKDFGMSGWSHSWHWSAAYDFKYPDIVLASCGEGGNQVCESDNNQFTTAINITFPDGHTTQYKIVRLEHGEWMVAGSYPQFGPPYTSSEITNWVSGGAGVHDYLKMAADGSQFWLCRSDGGSVHFVWDATYELFQAKAVYDPHGFKTTLSYTNGYLTRVEQEGGRYLDITWEPFSGGEYMITRVQSGSAETGITQTVNYYYTQPTGYWTLRQVVYENEPFVGGAPNQKIAATYDYGTCYGDGVEPCSGAERSMLPLLKLADDPHYAGAMTIIRYNYRGEHCPPHLVEPWDWPMYVPAQVWAVKSENDHSGQIVSSFTIECDSGKRREDNGLGGWRMFYYGGSAQTQESTPAGPALCRGYQLGKITDFTAVGVSESLPTQRQNFFASNPYHIWDGRGLRTETIFAAGDVSGEPAEVRHIDGSVRYFDRINPGSSEPLDPVRMHNSYNHWLFRQKDELNNETVYTRDSRRRVTRIDYPGGVIHETFSYNIFNQVTSHRLPSGAVKTYEYDGRGRLMREYNSVDRALDETNGDIEYTYDALDRVRTKKDGRARISGKDFSTQMSYNGRHQITRVEYAGIIGATNNPSIWYGYDAYGNCTAMSSELASYPGDPYHTKRYEYDLYRRCTAYIEPLHAPDWNGGPNVASRRWDWIYDRYIYGVGSIGASRHTSKEWRIQIEPVFNAAGERRMIARAHDVQNRLVSEETGWIQPSNAPIGNWYPSQDREDHWFSYDGNGQKNRYVDPRGRVTDYAYDDRNRLRDTIEPKRADQSARPTTTTDYDFAGNKTDVTFPDGKSQHWRDYDAFGQAGRFIDERNNTTHLSYQWGPMKKLDTVTTHRIRHDGTMEDQLTNFEYDGLGRQNWIIFPDNSSELTAYRYGQVDAFKTRKNQAKRFFYDARGREDYHTWDGDAAPGIDRTWDNASRLTSISNAISTIEYTYDQAGQVRTERNIVNGAGGAAQTTYYRYPDGSAAHIGYPGGTWVRHDYTARGQLKAVYENVGGYWKQPVVYHYLPDGKVASQNSRPGVLTEFEYDGRGFTSSIKHSRPGAELSRRNYYRDERDRIRAWQKGSANQTNPLEDGRGDHYWYDAEGQLTDAYYGAIDPVANPNNPVRIDYFAYDALGNRMGWNHLASRGEMTFERKNNGLNQYRGWWNYSIINYDDDLAGWGAPGAANGVLMQDGWITAGFNALNQPMYIWSANVGWTNFGFDPLGRCVKRWTDGGASTYLYYDGWNLIQEGATFSNAARLYFHGGRMDEIVASYNAATDMMAYHFYDASGHATLLTDWQGNLMEQYYYDAFGKPYFYTAGSGWNGDVGYSPHGNRFLFTGREWLADLKLYDYRNRMYQPELGRFMQPDPKHFEAGDYNLYRYCHNDPVNRRDPLGLQDEKVVREFTKNISVTGSHIPIHVRYTESGNWNDKKIANHYDPNLSSRTGNDGSTMGIGSVNQAGRSVHIDLNVNWFVDSKWRDTDVVARELQHVRDFRRFSRDFANSVDPNRPLPNLMGFPSKVRDFGADQQRKYDPDRIRGIMDKPHNTHLYPPRPFMLPTYENTVNELGP